MNEPYLWCLYNEKGDDDDTIICFEMESTGQGENWQQNQYLSYKLRYIKHRNDGSTVTLHVD